MVALLLLVYVGFTIYAARVLFIITISIDYKGKSVAISTYIIGNGLKLSRMWWIYYFSKLLLDWTILCVDYSLYNQTNHFHSYWNKYTKELGTNIGWIYQFGVCHITIVGSIIYVGEL